MSDMEKNRQIVQEGLNKRSSKQKQALIDAEQDAITDSIIAIVNENAAKYQQKMQMEMEQAISEREKRILNKRIVRLKDKRNTAVFAICIAIVFGAASGILFVKGITEFWMLIVAAILTAVLIFINAYFVILNAIKLSKLIKGDVKHA